MLCNCAHTDQEDYLAMSARPPSIPRSRLQELLAIPERLRTDAQWDEINELEISLTPVNREVKQESSRARNPAARPAVSADNKRPQGKKSPNKPFKKFAKPAPR